MAKTEYPAPAHKSFPRPFVPAQTPRSPQAKIGHFARRVMFVLVGASLILAVLMSCFQALIAQIEPQLTPAVPSTTLTDNALVPENENGIYIQKSDMTLLEMPNLTEPVRIVPDEVLHLKADELDSLVLRPKQMDNFTDYKLYTLDPQVQDNDIRITLIPGTNAVHIYPGASGWQPADYMLQIPQPGGMFGGQYYTYFTIVP